MRCRTNTAPVRRNGEPSRSLATSLARLAWAVLGLAPFSAQAYDAGTSPYLLGDWNGQRTRLAEQGVTFGVNYVSELARNLSGGTEDLTRYADQWAFSTTLDMQKVAGWRGATFQFTMTDRNGRNLGADAGIGNNMLVQEVYGRGQTWHLTQLWVNQKLFDDRLEIKLGRLTVGEDFASFSCDFQNLTFCGAQPGNLVGSYWVNWPTSQWASRVKYRTSQDTYAQIGIYQVNPNYVDDSYARHNGWKPNNPGGTTGALLPLEVGWLPALHGRPGSYKLGGWYNTSQGSDLYYDINHNPRGVTGLDPLQRSGQFGVYINVQQQITGTQGGRGATVFLNVSQADRNTAQLDHQIALGVQYAGPFETRLRDSIGLAFGATHNNDRFASYVAQNNARTGSNTLAGSGYEYVTELYYAWSPASSVLLRPNVQYILHPGGTSHNGNAFLIGLKSSVTF